MHSSRNYYGPSKLELVELPKMKNTLRNRQLIDKYITNFCALSRFQRITIPGIASNLEAYIARQMFRCQGAQQRPGIDRSWSLRRPSQLRLIASSNVGR